MGEDGAGRSWLWDYLMLEKVCGCCCAFVTFLYKSKSTNEKAEKLPRGNVGSQDSLEKEKEGCLWFGAGGGLLGDLI